MLIIGLTGGIGCGKSAVAERFASFGVPVIDADDIARQVVAKGQPALAEIALHFGPKTMNEDGTLNRRALRETIFQDSDARRALEGILHPRIRTEMARQLESLNAPYAILSIPLLLETGQEKTVDRVLVIDCPQDTQIRRVCTRDRINPDQVRSILAVQCSRSDRLARADDIIDNSASPEALTPQVEHLHRAYLRLAQGTP